MELNNLKPAKGSTHRERRIGRGEGSGKGGTSTRGHKGAQSRSGYSHKLGFEGGQMPLQRRLPKFGFTNKERVEFKPINLSTLEDLATAKNLTAISVDTLVEAGFVSKNDKVKILANGSLTKALTVTAHAFSKSAEAAIEGMKGKAIKLAAGGAGIAAAAGGVA
jgi:large subunit ribosomal protein L15